MIQVENVSKRFADVQAVKDISFQVEKGKIWGFLGPNGAGKTTTMRILTGYLPPNEGRALINGIDVSTDLKSIKKIVGYLPEVVPVYSDLTVKEFLRFVAELYGIERKKIRFAIDRVVEKTNLQDVYGRLIKNISRGYRQRLGIAQAIIHEPEVLILDEPTIGLDPAQIIEIREMIRSFKDSATVILSSHSLAEITQVCDGAVIIKEGRLMATPTRDEWGKNLEIVTTGMAGDTDWSDLKQAFPVISEVRAEGQVLKLEFSETLNDFNKIIKYLIEKDIRIKEIKAGLEALYMKIILAEEGRGS
ncbi:MAG: ABC transporter ATP-binding protein [Acidobacteria bacterium]|nr:ABC transporter ATP-binding protein [Acidobacteriota bacterium]MBU4307548.1 ABC transporter ATP-binding protein [Acidobacteriota bacterium]MCG2811275.1 ABC transporter ATP-binding protein [Candidatus Aminicenantes bacterium]